MAGIVAAGAFFRAWPIAEWPLSHDEVLTWLTAGADPVRFLSWSHHPHHPPLSYALVRLSTWISGTNAEWALRLPAVLAGSLSIPAAFLFGRMAWSSGAGLALAALVAFDPLLVSQGRQARMYALLVLILLISLSLLAHLIRRKEERWAPWTLLGALLAGAFWTHILGLAVWLGIGLAGLLAGRGVRKNMGWALGLGATLSIVGLIDLADTRPPRHTEPIRDDPLAFLAVVIRQLAPDPERSLVMAGLIAAGVAGLFLLHRRSPAVALGLGVVGAASAAVVLLVPQVAPYGAERYLILTRLAVYAGFSVLVLSPTRPAARMTGICALVGLVAVFFIASFPNRMPPDLKVGAVLRELSRDHYASGDAVTYRPVYLRREARYYSLPDSRIPLRAPPLLPEYRARTPRTWVVLAHGRVLPTWFLGRDEPVLAPESERALTILAELYGIPIDLGRIRRLVAADGVLAVGIGPEGVNLLTPDGYP